jgi:hypothetical protein
MKSTSIVILVVLGVWFSTNSEAVGQAHPSSGGNSQEQAYYDAYFAKQRAQQAAADAAAKTYDGCCNNDAAEALNYCKHWVDNWSKESPAWEGWEERRFRISVRTRTGATTYCPEFLLDQYTNPYRVPLPNVCYDAYPRLIKECDTTAQDVEMKQRCDANQDLRSKLDKECDTTTQDAYTKRQCDIHQNLRSRLAKECDTTAQDAYMKRQCDADQNLRSKLAKECDTTRYRVTLPEKQLAEIATAQDEAFANQRCQENDPRPIALKQADPLCVQIAQEAVEAKQREKEQKQAEAAEAKKEARLKLTEAARRDEFKALGLHRYQTQEQVKSLLFARGFAWACDTKSDITVTSGYSTTCMAKRHPGRPDQDNVLLLFSVRQHQHRDPDTGFVRVESVERRLLLARYAHENDDEDVLFGGDNESF